MQDAVYDRTKGRKGRWWVVFPLAVLLAFPGCKQKMAAPEILLNLATRFQPVTPPSSGGLETLEVIRKGRRRKALILVAPAKVRALLPGKPGKTNLICIAAPVFDVGDGIQMELSIVRAGGRFPVGNRFFDAGRRAEDRNWVVAAFPIESQVGDELEIEVLGGPQGDLTADWLALGSVFTIDNRLSDERLLEIAD
jgi:hypothetical protein